MILSQYQKDFLDFVKKDTRHGTLISVAGSGKSTVISRACEDVSEKTLITAFSKDIVDSIGRKIDHPLVEARTYNSIGHRACGRATFDIDKLKKICINVMGRDDYTVRRIVDIIKGRVLLTAKDIENDFASILVDHGFYQKVKLENVIDVWKASLNRRTIDYADQLYFPVYYNLPLPTWDTIFVDEFQDTNAVQMELLRRIRPNRIIAVGDPDQAIYSFRGTVPSAMASFTEEYFARELFLSICYRCDTDIVNNAKKYVPRIEAAPGRASGVVTSVSRLGAVVGDTVLCRTNARNAKECLRYMQAGIPSYVRGKDSGDVFRILIRMFGHLPYDSFYDSVVNYINTLINNYIKMDKDPDPVIDVQEMFEVLYANCKDCVEFTRLVDTLFKEGIKGHDKDAVVFMSMHKSKGLEFPKVWILPSKKIKNPSIGEEERIQYVAATRAEHWLGYVTT